MSRLPVNVETVKIIALQPYPTLENYPIVFKTTHNIRHKIIWGMGITLFFPIFFILKKH